jgi:AraC-like DNA-binding protein
MVFRMRLEHYPLLAEPSNFRNHFVRARMPIAQKTRVHSLDPEEVVRAVSGVYCPHTAAFGGRLRQPATFEVMHSGLQPVVALRYGAPVRVDAGRFPRLMLMQSCLAGIGTASQENVAVACRRGQTLPLSPGLSTQLEFDARFAQRSMRIDVERLETLCARLMNRPLDRPLRFELRPFSDHLERAWSQAVGLVLTYDDMALPLAAAAGFDEFLLSLVLTQHPHNYTDELQGRTRLAPPRLIREAEYLMRTGDAGLTVSEIACALRVSLRSLEAGFQEYRRLTPTQCLRDIRLEKVRELLLAPTASTSVTSAALESGFLHLPRFSGYYRAAFGESPAATLRRNRRHNR